MFWYPIALKTKANYLILKFIFFIEQNYSSFFSISKLEKTYQMAE